jgi:hypothetical protein
MNCLVVRLEFEDFLQKLPQLYQFYISLFRYFLGCTVAVVVKAGSCLGAQFALIHQTIDTGRVVDQLRSFILAVAQDFLGQVYAGEIEALHQAHNRSAQGQAILGSLIDILGRGIPVVQQEEHFLGEGALPPSGDVYLRPSNDLAVQCCLSTW